MLDRVPTIVIAGTSSGVGKTTVAIGLMAALRRRGLDIRPFKVGPDYIDPTYHLAAAGVPSRNLDSWMVSEAALRELFARASRGADIAMIEGVMGVFDGYSGLDEQGSTAQIAKLLGAPVVLVLDVGKAARSAGAMALGYARFDPALQVAGFLLNRVGSETHYLWCKQSIEAAGAGSVLGYLPSDPTLKLSERHLGLIPTGEQPLPEGFLDRLAALVETHVDLDSVIAVSRRLSAVSPYPPTSEPHPPLITHHSSPITLFPAEPVPVGATIGVARDETFNFYYQDNLDLLEAHGAELVPFSPLHDAEIPAGVDALYLGGGFPEMQAERLAANRSMLQSVRRAAESGMPVYAECGGLMYLSQGIVNGDGGRYPMVGAVPGWCSMAERRLSMGYVNVRSVLPSPLGPAGIAARGHEFHWSRWDGLDPSAGPYRVANQGDRPEGYARGNLLATFVHLHFGANRNLAPNFVASARAYREKRMPHG